MDGLPSINTDMAREHFFVPFDCAAEWPAHLIQHGIYRFDGHDTDYLLLAFWDVQSLVTARLATEGAIVLSADDSLDVTLLVRAHPGLAAHLEWMHDDLGIEFHACRVIAIDAEECDLRKIEATLALL